MAYSARKTAKKSKFCRKQFCVLQMQNTAGCDKADYEKKPAMASLIINGL
jgi:hypothetical protein